MLILLKAGTTESTVTDVMSRLRMLGLSVHRTDHDRRVRLAAMGDGTPVDFEALKHWPGVESVEKIPVPFKLVSRTFHPADTVISVGRCAIGSGQLALMAGPCSIEGEEQAFRIAEAVSKAGATVMREPLLTRSRDWGRRASRSCAAPPTRSISRW